MYCPLNAGQSFNTVCVLLILIVYCYAISRMVSEGLETTVKGYIEWEVLAVLL